MDIYTITNSVILKTLCKFNSKQLFTISTTQLNKILLNNNDLAAGCKNTNFGIFDIEIGIQKWQAKAYPRDDLNLEQKVDVVDLKYVDRDVYYNLSVFNRIYKYDTRVQRKESSDFDTKLDPEFSTTCFDIKENMLAVANNIGSINLFDIRNTKNVLKKFVDHEGSIKDIKFHSNEPKLITGKLNRLLR